MRIARTQAGGLLAVLLVSGLLAGCGRPLDERDVRFALVRAVDSSATPAGMTPARWAMVRGLYQERKFEPLWTGLDQPTARGREFVNALVNAEAQGLRPSDYDLRGIRDAMVRAYQGNLKKDSIPSAVVALELRLTRTFLDYGTNLFSGRLDPIAVDSGWFISVRRSGVDSALGRALRAKEFSGMVAPLLPHQQQYGELVQALATYRQLAARGGWAPIPVPARIKLRPGEVNSIIPFIRHRLAESGQLADSLSPTPFLYDSVLAGAVARFQDLHGLETDSTIGKGTIEAMNIPVDTRIAQIELNMERYRWLPDDLGQRYVLVNIPDYQLHAYDEGREAFTMRVVVGKDFENPTPVFADSMSYIVFRPYWNVPPRIIKEELVPAARKDSSYIGKHEYELLRGNEVIDPATINWAKVDTAHINFRVRQKPGPANSLGLIKFMFPNQFDVYLHDTPARGLFRRAGRAASHGCIRVERPEQLAQFALARNTDWNLKKIRDALHSEDPPEQVGLRQKVPVYIVYFTSFVRDGTVRFRTDLYGTDSRAISRLQQGLDRGASRAIFDSLLQLSQVSRRQGS
ncbi:MAG TPA: L,D-transpeptidase family protein [Gemmatimonadales bacterium]|jgi:murein L,D-transpeptidase YcbB/YkuD|nr:L,D-transpeptidase family protein [Gemmatimonadales bacterium]